MTTKMIPLPSREELLATFRYEPETGKVYRLKNGARAFCGRNTSGSLFGKHKGISYLAHRIIWKMVTGEEPNIIDHDDRDRSNNRWRNLIDGTQSQNMKNVKLRADNSSGRVGVYFIRRSGKWAAAIGHRRSFKHLGTFPTKELAIEARKMAEIQYDFHPNHGQN